MYFKKIEMNGFKSFAEPVTIDFQDGITCVVGPNGSGKSNIADAIRWVLGEQSAKTLRGGKMQEVIFSGTSARKAKSMAEVTLVIDNTTGILPIDYSEVQIRRRLYRSGESEYSINSNKCRLRDVRELIMDTGIGVDGYSLIGQGKISEIISEDPDDRRAIFEEAAGISKYRNKKDEAERKLERSINNRDRINDIISEIELRIDPLKEESKNAKEYVALRDRHKELEINIALKSIENIHKKNGNIEEELVAIEERLTSLNIKKNQLDESLSANRTQTEELTQKSNRTRDELLKNVEETNVLKNNAELNEERKRTADKDKARLETEINELDSKLITENENESKLCESIEATSAELNRLTQILDEKSENLGKLHESIEVKTNEIADKKNRIISLHREKTEKQSEISSIKNLKDTLGQRKEKVAEENEAFVESRKASENFKERKKHNLKEIEYKIDNFESEKNRLNGIKSNNEGRIKLTKESIEKLQISIGQMHARKKTIEEMEANYEGYNSGVKYLMKERTPGLNGIVAELLDTDTKYEIAVEAALGSNMQNVVVQDINSANQAIDLLKREAAGKVTFLPIDDLKSNHKRLNMESLSEDESSVLGPIKKLKIFNFKPFKALLFKPDAENVPDKKNREQFNPGEGFIGYLIDYVHFDKQYETAIEYLLGDVMIADELNNAVELSKKNKDFKIVTLAGEIITPGGAITGGSNENRSVSAIARKTEIAELEKSLVDSQNKRSTLIKQLESLEQELTTAINAIKNIDEEIKSCEIELTSISTELKSIDDKDLETNVRREKWEKEISDIDKEIERSQAMIDTLVKSINEFDIKEKVLEQEINEDETVLADLKGQLELANEDVVKTRLDAGSVDSSKENNDRILLRIRTSIQELESQKKQKQEQYNEILDFEKGVTENGLSPEEMLAEKAELKGQLERQIEDINSQRNELAKLVEESSTTKEQLEEELETLKAQKADMDVKRAKQDTQVDSFKEKLWDEFEISYAEAIDKRDPDFIITNAIKENREIKARLKELGDVNIGAIKDYEETSERYEFYTTQRDDVTEAIESLQKIISETDSTIRTTFKRSFEEISANFGDTFGMLFGGGNGELALEDPNNPLDSGIVINAQPPGKKLQNMNLLSGGEKTMTAIALMFSILRAKPTPFCVLDEIEAALDDNNIKRFADYLGAFSETQFTLVTHQKTTMEYADVLYGVTMPEKGISRILSLKLGEKETEEFAKQLN